MQGPKASAPPGDFPIPSAGKWGPTVIDKSQPIESIGSGPHDRARTPESKVHVWSWSLDPIDSIG